MTTATTAATNPTTEMEIRTNGTGLEERKGSSETEIRAAARKRGLTMKELAKKMGVSPSHLSQVGTGKRPWTPMLREKAMAVLGEVPGQGIVYRQNDVVEGESSFIRESARVLGMSLRDLADRVGVSASHMTQIARGQKGMGVKVQARVESALQAPAKVEPAQCPDIDRRMVWDRMDELGISQNEAARRAGISSGHLSQIMNGQRSPSARVLRSLHAALFQRTGVEERVMPVEMKVMGWKKGERSGMVVHGARGRDGTTRGGAVRVGGHVPWGADVEYAYRSGYDGRGKVSVTHVVTPGYSVLLKQPEAGTA